MPFVTPACWLSRRKLDCDCRGGLSGGARFGTAGAESIDDVEGTLRISTAVVGLSDVPSSGGGVLLSVGRLSVDLNLEVRPLDIESFPRDTDRGGEICDGGVGGSGMSGGTLRPVSSIGATLTAGPKWFPPVDGYLVCPSDDALGWLRCDRREMDRRTLFPRSATFDRLKILLSLLCPLLLFSLSVDEVHGALNVPS